MILLARAAATLVAAALLWIVLAYLLTGALGAVYGWSGHPPLPRTPDAVAFALFALALPLASLAVAWWAAGLAMRRFTGTSRRPHGR